MISKQLCLQYIDSKVIEERLDQVDPDFLEYEVKMMSLEDINRVHNLLTAKDFKFDLNPNNSILLYITGLTDEFDFNQMRSNMIGGAPPDIDIDHDALEREKAIQWCIDYWGREKVANIITHGTFKPKSLARSYYRITEKDQEDLADLLKLIPPPKYGKEATLEEILALNPELSEEERYKTFLEFADRIEDMVANFGIHAAGIIISDKEVSDVIPIWKNSKADRITQFDKDECEELGMLKFDFLGIDTISIIKECVSLIKKSTGQDINPYTIEDGDSLAYEKMSQGHLVGVFQMETSGTAKRLILDIKPNSIEDLSAISAIDWWP
jgi:DNA polymerase III subunit alpha